MQSAANFVVYDRDWDGGIVSAHRSSGISGWGASSTFGQICPATSNTVGKDSAGAILLPPILEPHSEIDSDGYVLYGGSRILEPSIGGANGSSTQSTQSTTNTQSFFVFNIIADIFHAFEHFLAEGSSALDFGLNTGPGYGPGGVAVISVPGGTGTVGIGNDTGASSVPPVVYSIPAANVNYINYTYPAQNGETFTFTPGAALAAASYPAGYSPSYGNYGSMVANYSDFDDIDVGRPARDGEEDSDLGGGEAPQPMSAILAPGGQAIGTNTQPNVNVVTPEEFNSALQGLQNGATLSQQQPSDYSGILYERADGTSFGIRNSIRSGPTIDIFDSNGLVKPGFKLHQSP